MALNLGNLPSSRREQVSNMLREAILTGELKPGEKLKEIDLSHQIGVSRGPIREAIRQLEQEGYLISYPYKGTVVAHMNDEEVSEVLIPIRNILENYSLKKAFESDLDIHIQKLEGFTEEMEHAANTNNVAKLVENNLFFHQYIISITESSALEQIWHSIMNRIRFHFYKLGEIQSTEELNRDVCEHKKIVESLKANNIKEALDLLNYHIK